MTHDLVLFSGTANPELARGVAAELRVRLGLCSLRRFPDGETEVRIDDSVRGREVFFVQPTAPSVNDNLMELLAFADACRRSAAAGFTAVVPYFGYARADKRHGRRQPITASLVAKLMQTAGVDQVLTLDLHADQIEGFFQIPVDNLTAVPALSTRSAKEYPRGPWLSRRIPDGSPWPPITHTGLALRWPSCTRSGPAAPRPSSLMSSATSAAGRA